MTMIRTDGRAPDEIRPVAVQLDAAPYAEGSCLISMGATRVLCTASVELQVPGWRKGSGKGWVTAEYAMLPRATHTRSQRERGQIGGRTQEIQRLIGRSLRACVDLSGLGETTIRVDCDVLQADGGTRTASITGGALALAQACDWLVREGVVSLSPFRQLVAAVSVGIVDGVPLLDLDYSEDSRADVDMNVVALEDGGFIELQGTAERAAFPRAQLEPLLDHAERGLSLLGSTQRGALAR